MTRELFFLPGVTRAADAFTFVFTAVVTGGLATYLLSGQGLASPLR